MALLPAPTSRRFWNLREVHRNRSPHGSPKRGTAFRGAGPDSPDGKHVYVASDNADMLLSLGRDPQTGRLAFIEEATDNVAGVDGLENGWSIAISPDGRNVYVAGFDDDSLSVFTRDISSGSLTFTEVIRNKADQ